MADIKESFNEKLSVVFNNLLKRLFSFFLKLFLPFFFSTLFFTFLVKLKKIFSDHKTLTFVHRQNHDDVRMLVFCFVFFFWIFTFMTFNNNKLNYIKNIIAYST